MRLSLHTVICCCVFTAVLLLVKGATGELNTSPKKRVKRCVQRRMKRELCNSFLTANEQRANVSVAPQQDESEKTVPPPSSTELHVRPRRSTQTKSAGCVLVTCAYQELIHRLHILHNEQKERNAPWIKIGATGYGRRRRSLLDVARLALQTASNVSSAEKD
ncbi:pro-adrenomedullin-like [Centropristis striata]|uniref:pro-adrenomedullin-like n=1 Tax=Centropristis striata TaxID=184440 RepID=UPI0027DFA87C|nr:pro-adrenomedullin-like [Centropristis striata]